MAGLGCPAVEGEEIYAVFDVEFDGEYVDWRWDGAAVNELLLALERRRWHLRQGLTGGRRTRGCWGWRICGERGCEPDGAREWGGRRSPAGSGWSA